MSKNTAAPMSASFHSEYFVKKRCSTVTSAVPLPATILRIAATQATRDAFFGRAFAWGQADCAQLLAFHLRGMGHRIPLAKVGSYKSALGAKRALARFGVATLAEAMDRAGFARIPPAAAVAGDVLELPGSDGFAAMTVALGNGRVLGWHETTLGAAALQPVEFVAAWRVELA